MKAMGSGIFLAMLVAGALCVPAQAQRNSNYAVKEMNFDLWCQLQANLPAERCDKRTAQDEAASTPIATRLKPMKSRICSAKTLTRAWTATSCTPIR